MSNTPQIRFAGYTDAWEQRKLGDIVTVYDGVHQTPNYQTSGVMFLSVENIETLKSNKFISIEDFKRDYKVYPQRNDILMTRIGDVGTTNVVTDNDVKAYYVSLALLKYKETNPFFLSSAIQSDFVQKGLSNRTLKTAIPMKINKDEIGQVDVMLPTSADEQDKIGSFFSQLDTLITLHQRKCDALQKFKKSMLQKMFPQNGESVPEIRFAGFTDAWEQRKFSDLAQRESAVEVSSPDCPSVEYEDVIVEEGRLNKDIRLKETQKTGIKFDGTQVLYGKLRPYLHNWLNPDFTGVAVGDWWVLRPICIDKDYLYRLIQTKQFDDVANQSAGSKMPRADWNLISNTEFFVPISMEEQGKIAQAFTNLDTLITLHQRKLETLQKMKKSLLQKMFV